MIIRTLMALLALCLGSLPTFAGPAITVTPASEGAVVNTTRQYTATVSGISGGVNWYVNGVPGGDINTVGSVSSSGLYTAPAKLPSPNPVAIKAESVMDPTVFGIAKVTVYNTPPTTSSLSPWTLPVGAYTLKINGSGFLPGAAVLWNSQVLTPAVVTSTQITVTGSTTSAANVLIRVVNPGSTPSNGLWLGVGSTSSGTATPTISLSPQSVAVPQSATQQFTGVLSGGTGTITWSATAGTVSASGLYTAPAVIPSPATVTITATGPNNVTATAGVLVISNVPPTISDVNPAFAPVGVFNLTVNGTGFGQASTVTLNGTALAVQSRTATQLVVSGFAKTSGSAPLVVSNGPIASQPFQLQIGVANPLVSDAAARRFLEQAAFGPTAADAMKVQTLGFGGWIDSQAQLQPVSNYNNLPGSQGGLSQRFLTNAVMNPDQLRQRVAFAWQQIFVASLNKIIWTPDMVPYQNMLLNNAFVNFRQMLYDVTLSPVMGKYLDMANNGKGNAAGTILANENFAREVLQLFAIGTVMLDPYGNVIYDAQNNPVPTYDQSTIAQFAKVFTGWTYAPSTPGGTPVWNTYWNGNYPMVPVQAMHDTTQKTLLLGTVLPAGQTAQADLNAAIDNMFNHPNVGPFICKQLIQKLVKSNPTGTYINNCVLAFNNTAGVRGDIKAVIKTILTDPEARAGDNGVDSPNDGHLKEPALFLATALRAVNANVNDQHYYAYELANLGQDIMNSPSVFNFYSPGYVVPGTNGLLGGEFQIYTPYTSIYRANLLNAMFSAYQGNVQTIGPGVSFDLTPFVNLAANPASLADALDITLTRGQMPSAMKQILTTAITNETGGDLRRVQTGMYVVLSSAYHNVTR